MSHSRSFRVLLSALLGVALLAALASPALACTYKIQIQKTDATSGAKLAGATFQLLDGTSVKATATTDVNGNAVFGFGVTPGHTYTIHETAAPAGYKLVADKPYTVNTSKCGPEGRDLIALCSVAIADPRVYQLEAKKLDGSSEKALAGAKFQLKQGSTLIGGEVTTGADGKVLWTNLDPATYTIVETFAPDGYAKSGDVTVVIPGTGTLCSATAPFKCGTVFISDPRTYDLELTKFDAASKALMPGAGFTLFKDDAAQGAQKLTGADGKVKWEDLAAGSYTIKETLVPVGYDKAADVTVTIPGEGCGSAVPVKCTVTINDPRLYEFVLKKTDATSGAALAGAIFTLTGSNYNSGQVTTDASGQIAFHTLKAGTYTLHEVSAPDGYSAVTDQTVVIPSEGCTAAAPFTCGFELRDPRLYDFTVQKLDGTSQAPLAGVGFRLKVGDAWATDEQLTGADGKAHFEDLAAGSYTLVETTVPAGYAKLADTAVTIPGDDCTSTAPFACSMTLSNARLYSLSVLKSDETSEAPMVGAGFTLTQGDWSSAEVITGADGKATFTGLAAGTYTIKETTVPAGYAKAADKAVTIPFDGCTEAVPFGCTVDIDDARVYDIVVQKQDGVSAAALQGAGFTLTQGDWSSDEVMTGADGKAAFSGLAAGTYTLEETTVPAGYQKVADQVITVPGEACTATAPFTCTYTLGDPRLYELNLEKRDSYTEHPIEGAGFTLVQGDWSSDEAFTDAEGGISWHNLPAGSYTIVETTVPDGYAKADDVTVTIPNDGCSESVPFTCTQVIWDDALFDLKVMKVDASTDEPLKGAGFKLEQDGKFVTDEVFTGDDGLAIFHNLLRGEYVVVETTVPAGYEKAADQTVEVPYGYCEGGDGEVGCTWDRIVVEDEPVAVKLTLIKVSCPDFGLVPANKDPQASDATGGNWAKLNNKAQTMITTPDDIPAGCTRVSGWTFNVDEAQFVTKEDGSVDVDLTVAQVVKAQSASWENGILVSEVIPDKSDLGFAAIRCFRDIQNGDNLESIYGLTAEDTHLYCIAFNVPPQKETPTPPTATPTTTATPTATASETTEGKTATPVPSVTPTTKPSESASASESIGGATGTPHVTPPPTSSGTSGGSNDELPIIGFLVCAAFGSLGLLAIQAQRRVIRR